MDCPVVGFQGIELQSACELGNGDKITAHTEYTPNRKVSNLEEHEILTSCGLYLRVYVQPSKGKLAMITYHDIGTNHTSFLSFFNLPEMRVICQRFTVYHICAPGHHENALNVCLTDSQNQGQNQVLLSQPNLSQLFSSRSSLTGSRGSIFDAVRRKSSLLINRNNRYPEMDQLADMINSVLVHFGINYFVGFGMGAGSNVLSRYALHNPDHVLGLFLLNPSCTSHSYFQWFRNRWSDLPALERGVMTDNLMNQLEDHWFGYGLVENEDVANFYQQLAHSLNPFNLAGYIRSFIDRTPLNIIRPTGPTIPELDAPQTSPTVIQTDVCLVTGERAVELSRALAAMNGNMDPKHTQFLMIPDSTGMVMEENPTKLAVNFLHFLRSIGLLINLTPEKLHQQAIELQQSLFEENADENPAKLAVDTEA